MSRPLLLSLSVGVIVILYMVFELFSVARMPGRSFSGTAKLLTSNEKLLKKALTNHVTTLATLIGERNVGKYENLNRAADYIATSLRQLGYEVSNQSFDVAGREVRNLEIEIAGSSRPAEIVVIGAHYDSVTGTPGANDNATGVAATLELARMLKDKRPDRTLRFVFFVNEEPPFFMGPNMGSVVYARKVCERGDKIQAMLSLETMGYYSSEPNSQKYPPGMGWLFPDRGDFIGFVGNTKSKRLVRQVVGTFREHAQLPSEGVAAPENITGIGWSDHWSFWNCGYQALMVTDTAQFRYQYYHTALDTPERVNYEQLTRVVSGLEHVVEDLAH